MVHGTSVQKYKHPKKWLIFCKSQDNKKFSQRMLDILKTSGRLISIKKCRDYNHENILTSCFYQMFKYTQNIKLDVVPIEANDSLDIMYKLMPKAIETPDSHDRTEIEQVNVYVKYNMSDVHNGLKNYMQDIFRIKLCIKTFFQFYPYDLNKVNLLVYIEIINKYSNNHNHTESVAEGIFNDNIEWKNLMFMKNMGLCRKIVKVVKSNVSNDNDDDDNDGLSNLEAIHILFNQ